ncbi:MAG: energy transducer TonB [Bacteroidetes bacterium]|nr:energy transducer TonB [Bacteroidota bacterium]
MSALTMNPLNKRRSLIRAKSKLFFAWPLIITVTIFVAGITFSIKSYAQYNQYNQYETQAGTPALAPPRHHNPPQDKKVKDSIKVYQKIEKQPEYPGGTDAMFKFIFENMKYPKEARSKNIEGKVIVNFTVRSNGLVTDVETMRGIGGGCDEEAVRLVKLMPKWKPGEDLGKPIDVSMIVPVKFSLDTIKVKK